MSLFPDFFYLGKKNINVQNFKICVILVKLNARITYLSFIMGV